MTGSISTKELSAIEDQLSTEYTLIQKYRAFSVQCTDPVLKTKCTQFADKHQGHFNTLMSQLS